MTAEEVAALEQALKQAGGGTYCLVLLLPAPARITAGRLDTFDLAAGWYLYFGSALGGLRGRVMRHLRAQKRRHWHVDYLLMPDSPSAAGGIAEVVEVWWVESPTRLECAWARAALASPGISVPIPGFGSSDCRCPAHLIAWPRPENLAALRDQVSTG